MSTITIPRPDLTAKQVADVLRDGLGSTYNVLPAMRQTRAPFSAPEPGTPDTIVVGKGSNRVVRAQVSLTRQAGQTVIHISPGGLVSDLVLNTLGVARRIHKVLANAPELAGER